MGADWKAYTFVGIPFNPDDFVDKIVTETQVCAHPEADPLSVKFCPMCGMPRNQRSLKSVVEQPKEAYRELPFFKMFWPHNSPRSWKFRDYLDDNFTVGSLRLLNAAPSSEDESVLLLGEKVAEVPDHRRYKEYGAVVKDATEVEAIIARVRQQAEQFGLKYPVKVYTVLYVSC